ncbi:MAG: CinA family nicotinamide mononucleotide deamidase-related protein [Pseudomonadota bacterium]
MTSNPDIQLLLTGDELMSGDTVDSNSALIARELSAIGLSPRRRITLGDDRAALEREIAAMTKQADGLIINGGLGPTIDDLTAEVLAAAAVVPLREHEEALQGLQAWCDRRRLPLNDANRKQAKLPEGCFIVNNPVGSAPGFGIEVNGCLVICTPGVPSELRAMLPEILDRFGERFGTEIRKQVLRLQTFGIGESSAQQLVKDHCPDWPEEVVLSFRAGAPQLEIKLSVSHDEHLPLRAQCRERLEALFGDHIIGENDTRMAEAVIDLARRQRKRITCAESCTGGMVASLITQIAGSSDVFPGGFVTYSNALKASVLGVTEQTLDAHGAVSRETVIEMARGALREASADLAVAISGIAGPGGGTREKPVGTVWIAWGDEAHMDTICLRWPVERILFQTMVSAAALDGLRRRLSGIEKTSSYFEQRRVDG